MLIRVLLVQRGSSPRVRGTHRRQRCRSEHRRFIPACAGNAVLALSAVLIAAVHPRVCGERLRAAVKKSIPLRFIPACAGNATRPVTDPRTISVHPRVCGERSNEQFACIQRHGSSPRVRGTRQPRGSVDLLCRFIPACAGNALRCSRMRCRSSVHPRVCGERASAPSIPSRGFGSSPRVRGTHPEQLGA